MWGGRGGGSAPLHHTSFESNQLWWRSGQAAPPDPQRGGGGGGALSDAYKVMHLLSSFSCKCFPPSMEKKAKWLIVI